MSSQHGYFHSFVPNSFTNPSAQACTREERPLVIGLDFLGVGIARSLTSVFHVMGYGKDAAKADALQGSHVSAVTGLSVACRDASHVFFVVQSGQQVLGITKDIKETIRQHLTSLTIVLLTTMAPKLVLTVRMELAKLNAGVSLLEAPMSGSPAKAEKGELTACELSRFVTWSFDRSSLLP